LHEKFGKIKLTIELRGMQLIKVDELVPLLRRLCRLDADTSELNI
jgi:hypothetical protein